MTTTFGVSGYLMESGVLLWDRATQTLWSQIDGKGIAGPRSGSTLESISLVDTSWARWRDRHPGTRVLKGPLPAATYRQNPYPGYRRSDRVMFSVSATSDALPSKAIVTGLTAGRVSVAWSHETLVSRATAVGAKALRWSDEVGGVSLELRYDPVGDSLEAFVKKPGDDAPDRWPSTRLYWFAWYAFHPGTELRVPPSPAGR